MCNELINDIQLLINKYFIMFIYVVCFFVIKLCIYWDFLILQVFYEYVCLFYEKCNVDCVGKMFSNIIIYDVEIKIKYLYLNQGFLIQCYFVNKDFLVESILKENNRSCVIFMGYLFCCNDVYISFIV